MKFIHEQHYCGKHGFQHGGEAEHLRDELEKLATELEGTADDYWPFGTTTAEAAREFAVKLRRILEIDARDSLACLEERELVDEDEDA